MKTSFLAGCGAVSYYEPYFKQENGGYILRSTTGILCIDLYVAVHMSSCYIIALELLKYSKKSHVTLVTSKSDNTIIFHLLNSTKHEKLPKYFN